MSFDKDTRNLLAKTVAACRRRLVEDVTDQLRGVFGLHPDGVVLPLEKLTHLSPDQHAAARRLRDLLDHYTAGAAGKDSDRRKAAYERMVLEISFTALNRLAALRLCEERGLVVECVRKGTTSAGFQMFERISGGALGGRYDTYRVFLECLFDELALDLGVLFDRMTPQSAVFPSERCMEDVLAELNKTDLTHLWTEDETIGWVYQYFNPPEERKAMRDASQAPRNSRELAVRNQFFTPRYVVEFLTDNTLGRIWHEMRKGDTELKEECRYLVRRPNEVFLGPGEKAPACKDDETGLDREELLKRPVYIEHRPKKDPRDLRILDPACGSGHFLLYAFDLLERIFEEAWSDSESPKSEVTGRTIQEDFETLDDLRRETPKLIVEHNLHGIDIDPRAVQIAASALWLRAQKTWKSLGLKAQERPRIARSNIVTAEPMPGEEDMRREFTAGLKPRVLGQIVDEVFEKMKLAGEAGSLLKIEEEIKDAVAAAGKQWREGPKPEQQILFPSMDTPRPKQQELRFDVKGITDERFWDQAEDRILDALKEYAERAENGHATRRRLFAEDAARGFAFIDLCRKRYDTVLMNPPFGESAPKTDKYLRQAYPLGYIDLYTAFLDRACQITPLGFTGAITSRTALTLSSFSNWRTTRLLGETVIRVCADLGYGVLDSAMVETACFTLSRISDCPVMSFIDLDKVAQKEDELMVAVRHNTARVFHVLPSDLLAIPNAAMAYFLEPSVRNDFRRLRCVSSVAEVFGGNATSDDARFIRCFWEVPANTIIAGADRKWRWISKGGEYSLFYTSIHLVLDWRNDGGYLGEYMYISRPRNGYLWGPKSWTSAHMGVPGVVWSLRSQAGISFRALPRDCVMSGKSAIVTTKNNNLDLSLLAILNTERIAELSRCLSTFGSYEKGAIASLPVDLTETNDFPQASRDAFRAVRASYAYFEADPHFSTTMRSLQRSLADLIQRIRSDISDQSSVLSNVLSSINEKYRCSSSDKSYRRSPRVLDIAEPVTIGDILSEFVGIIFGRWDVRIALDPAIAPKLPDPFDPLPVCPPGMLVGPDGLPAEPNRIVSEEWLRARPDADTLPPDGSVKNPTIPDSEYPLRISWDGVLVDDPGFNGDRPHRDDIVRRVREVFDLLWKDKSHEVEQEACDILGVSDLRDYFRKPAGFFQDHLKRYSKSRRKAPIYWPLSTPSGSYTIWLYYHRLNEQTLYGAVNKYVEPKISEVERGIAQIENDLKAASGREATRLTDRLGEARAFVAELRDLREELLRIAALPYKPDLNDGVIINTAPFHGLFRLRSWAKDTEDCWKKLAKGDYDWAHSAYTIWPDRVRKVCRTDRSIAIAHGLEDLCEVEALESKKKGGRGRRKKEAAR